MALKILFLTTASLSTNPRLVKELTLGKKYGIECRAIAFRLGGWSDENDHEIILQNGFNVDYISATRRPLLAWGISSILQRGCKLLDLLFKGNSWLLIKIFASDKRASLLLWKVKRIIEDFDLVIAHNQGAFYPASFFSKQKRIPFALDIEDFHPGEKCSWSERRRREFIFNKIVAKSNFIYCASPLIEAATLKLVKASVKSAVINNVFSEKDFSYEENYNDKISLVWFSQNINSGRGLELIVPSVYEKRNDFQLILIGNLNQKFYDQFLEQYSDCLQIRQSMPQTELNSEICKYDVGLALELDEADYNRQLCLTNKIWAYYQAGLFTLATDTPAQVAFIRGNQEHGVVVKQFKESIDLTLLDIGKKNKNDS